jgi:hypothetical protein
MVGVPSILKVVVSKTDHAGQTSKRKEMGSGQEGKRRRKERSRWLWFDGTAFGKVCVCVQTDHEQRGVQIRKTELTCPAQK